MQHGPYEVAGVFAGVSCGLHCSLYDEQQKIEVVDMMLTSPAFDDSEPIPKKFTCESDDLSPELSIQDVPSAAVSLVLIVDDPDAPPKVWEHWTVINIPADTTIIPEGEVPGKQLMNDFGKVEWGGPCPPPGKVHNYNFKLYALDTELDLEETATKADVEQAMQGHILEETMLIGTYQR